jgi:cobalt-zinc-cadmium efflux system outer membrane protein
MLGGCSFKRSPKITPPTASGAARATAQSAVVSLQILLGQSQPDGTTALATPLETMATAVPADLESAAVAARPDVEAAAAVLEQSESNVRLQMRQRIPDVTVSVQYERNPPSQANTVGVGVSLPLPLWNHNGGAIAAAKAARLQAEVQLDQRRRQAIADVTNARTAYHEALERMRRYRDSLGPKSADAAHSIAYAYEKGGASLVALLEAERNDNLIRVASVQAQADCAATGAVLLSALGRLDHP